jgi:homoserine O-acetyltransferase/O-succinyltransferase
VKRDKEQPVEATRDYDIFELGDIQLQMGATLRGAFLAYKTFGQLNADKTNAIVYPTWYSGRHTRARFPKVTFWDQVQQQHRLVTEKWEIETLPLVTGWSMGAGQTYSGLSASRTWCSARARSAARRRPASTTSCSSRA